MIVKAKKTRHLHYVEITHGTATIKSNLLDTQERKNLAKNLIQVAEAIWPVRGRDCIREFDACLDRLNNLLGDK